MSRRSADQIAIIFQQLGTIRTAVSALQLTEENHLATLRGRQTVDDDEALHMSFKRLADDITDMEEVLAGIGEAAGNIAKL
ncbi:hypothetical protein A462_28395 [Pseudomonas sp. Ag1]|uniref:hypothetical protein n=1 Tax=Pseudomonas sp. Ag1 TaxID=1197727 RepID=UPI000272CED7|nr:hypothetical protein [Pseudomonas sp. Ag1]EJF68228.1 hypothetical protein A462_28395 [Pseudomonas sp. Ag1]